MYIYLFIYIHTHTHTYIYNLFRGASLASARPRDWRAAATGGLRSARVRRRELLLLSATDRVHQHLPTIKRSQTYMLNTYSRILRPSHTNTNNVFRLFNPVI